MHTELVVLGGGPGGYAAAFLAADKGMNVVLIDEVPKLGGTCLLRGCIPSKALLNVAKVMSEAKAMSAWGIEYGTPSINLEGIRKRKQEVLDNLANGLGVLAKKRNVKVIAARGTFKNSHTLILEPTTDKADFDKELTYDHCILATGSYPARVPGLDIDSPRLLDSTGALELPAIPKTMLVIGGGYIGLEMGTVYAALGTEVTLVELTGELLPSADRDLVKPLEQKLKKKFKAIHVHTKVTNIKDLGDGLEVTFEGDLPEKVQKFEYVMQSVGRRPNSRNLGLENTSVQVDRNGFVTVDAHQRTSDDYILAIGDVAGEPMLAHKATHQGKVAVEVLLGEPVEFKPRAIPAVVYTDPEIAWAGMTEREAQESGRTYKVATFPWMASGRAQAVGKTEGLTKLIVEPGTERILGAALVGTGAGDMISEIVLCLEMGGGIRDLIESIHPHPTLSETVSAAGEVFLGIATDYMQTRGK